MNITKSNNTNVSFGIAFKKYTPKNGIPTIDVLNIKEELEMYKKIDKKLNNDIFVKTNLGLKSKGTTINNDNMIKKSPAIVYKDKTGEYFFADNKINLHGVRDAFQNLREKIGNIIEK